MKVLSATEVAAKTSMSVSNIRRMAREGKFPPPFALTENRQGWLEQDVDELQARITDNPRKGFIFIARKVSPAIANYIKKLKIPGIRLRAESKRFYPAGEISAHIVGFTNVDDKGIEGIERVYDQLLTGEDGEKKYIKVLEGYGFDMQVWQY